MPTEIFGMVQYPSIWARAAAFGICRADRDICLTLLQRRFIANRRFDTVTAKATAAGRYAAARWKMRVGDRANLYRGGVVLPLVALLMVSFSRLWTGHFCGDGGPLQFRLRADQIRPDPHRDWQQPVFLALAGATLGVVLSVLASLLPHTRQSEAASRCGCAAVPATGNSGIIWGLGFPIIAIRTPLYSTLTTF